MDKRSICSQAFAVSPLQDPDYDWSMNRTVPHHVVEDVDCNSPMGFHAGLVIRNKVEPISKQFRFWYVQALNGSYFASSRSRALAKLLAVGAKRLRRGGRTGG